MGEFLSTPNVLETKMYVKEDIVIMSGRMGISTSEMVLTRVKTAALYMVKNSATLGETAKFVGLSERIVHNDLVVVLPYLKSLYPGDAELGSLAFEIECIVQGTARGYKKDEAPA